MAVIIAYDSDFKSLISEKQDVVVKYYAGWCGACKLFAPKFRRLSEDERFSNVTFIDVNAEENPEARKLAGVDNLPFFATFKNGTLSEGKATSNEEQVVDMINKLKA